MQSIRLLYVYEERIPEELRELVRSMLPAQFIRREMTYETSVLEQKNLLAWCDVVFFAPGRFIPDEILASAKNCRLMQLWSSGYDKFNLRGAQKAGVPVANNGGANAISVAEHTVALMLAVNRRLPDSHHRATTGQWTGNLHGLDLYMLNQKRLGLVGFGKIGRAVAQRCRGFGMEIVYSDPLSAPRELEEALSAQRVELSKLLEESDVVSLHLHLNSQTHHLIDRSAITNMRDGAILINVSRAGLVETSALIEALKTGKLRGVGLDVFDREPTVEGEPLLKLENVVATHHIAGSSREIYETVVEASIKNFIGVMAGEQPMWRVG